MDNFCIRYQIPTNSEKAPYSKVCKVIKNYDASTKEEALFYIQISKDKEKPMWISMESFLETSFRDKFENKRFMNKCLRLFEKAVSNSGESKFHSD